jgi:glycosyltransferase involved in cell wall biosynthesis
MTVAMAHAVGNANVRHAALALAERGMLAEFMTCLAWDPRWLADRLLPAGVRAECRRRGLPEEVLRVTRTRPLRELGRLGAARLGLGALVRHETGRFSIDAVNRDLDRAFARRLPALAGLGGVYTYEDSAEASLAAARRLGIPGFYELPIGYWRAHRALLAEEAEREPRWAPTIAILHDGEDKLARKDRELALADTVVVPSDFVRATLAGSPVAAERIRVLPYGCSAPAGAARAAHGDGPLRLLAVGGLSQRKGLSYLFAAARELGRAATLTVIGRREGGGACPALDEELARVRYLPSLPHPEILREMRAHDVLLFPTLFDGFGLVILEALAQGLPVISTPNSGAPDVLTDGVDGFIVPIRDSAALVERVARLARDRALLGAMSQAALATARRATWEAYRARLATLVGERLAVPA